MRDAASVAAPRVALLAGEGDVRERIGGALREAGAELVLVVDPRSSSPDEIRQAAPQAILVALDAAIEDALDRYDGLLTDPAYMVIFEEAALAMQRVGWDAARWLRHLSAKLHRHDDVLPPGVDAEQDLQPSPGPLPPRREVADLAVAIAAFADEAQQHADEVPQDRGVTGLQGQLLRDADEDPAGDAVAVLPIPHGITLDHLSDPLLLGQGLRAPNEPGLAGWHAAIPEQAEPRTLPSSQSLPERIVLDREDWTQTQAQDAQAEGEVAPDSSTASRFGAFDWGDWQLTDAAASGVDDVAGLVDVAGATLAENDAAAHTPPSTWDAPTMLAPLEIVDDVAPEYDPAISGLDPDLIQAVTDLGLRTREDVAVREAHEAPEDEHMPTDPGADESSLEAQVDRTPDAREPQAPAPSASARTGGLQLADIDDDTPHAGTGGERVVREFDTSALSLADDADASAVASAAASPATQAPVFDSLLSGLSLVDVDSYGHGPERGGVLVEAGLGGPDAVRQLLAEIPEGFPRPLFVRLRLDGGRYDRLVTQMERAAQLPVLLAQHGLAAEPGMVYFLTPEFVLEREKSELVFRRAEAGADPATLPSVLPPQDSAILFLSGSDVNLVEQATSDAWQPALVAGQSEEGCYDATAAQALAMRGGALAAPAGLAQLLFDRWPSANAPARPASGELAW